MHIKHAVIDDTEHNVVSLDRILTIRMTDVLIIMLFALSFLDGMFSIHHVRLGMMEELNPLFKGILNDGLYATFMAVKLSMTALCCVGFGLFSRRDHVFTFYAVTCNVLLYLYIMYLHVTCGVPF